MGIGYHTSWGFILGENNGIQIVKIVEWLSRFSSGSMKEDMCHIY